MQYVLSRFVVMLRARHIAVTFTLRNIHWSKPLIVEEQTQVTL